MQDKFERFLCPALSLRAYTALTTNTAKEIATLHNTTPNATYAMSEAITATALLSSLLKPDSRQSLSLKISGSGPMGTIYIQTDTTGALRGYAENPQPETKQKFDSIDFSHAIGAGVITVTRDIGMKEPYSGVSPLIYGSIAKDTAYYLTTSEQIPSAVILTCDTDNDGYIISSGGILIQTLPDTPEESIAIVERSMQKSKTLKEHLGTGEDITSYLSYLLENNTLELLSSTSLHYQCSCSKDIVMASLAAVSAKDLEVMIEEDHGAEVCCTFCNKAYKFTESDLKDIIDKKEILQ
ncbi:MAG TPA: Hsp33 family molecular chaperone HslO [Spirochaetota bacterium]|nr:Hsp33 family molecular chaperone HslO [Spirochaetota bacterium]